MRLAFLSDPHLISKSSNPIARKDNCFKTSLRKFKEVCKYCGGRNIPLFIAGDLTDIPRSWYLLFRLISIIQNTNVEIYAVFGQHDTYLHSEQSRSTTILGILARFGLVKLLNSSRPEQIITPGGVDNYSRYISGVKYSSFDEVIYSFNVYGLNYGQNFGELEVNSPGPNILIIHAPIGKNLKFEGYTPKEILKAFSFFDIIHCGDIHQTFWKSDGDRVIVNSGPLIRKTADKEMFKHKPGFWIYNCEEDIWKYRIVKHIPAKDVLSRKHLDKEADKMLDEFSSKIDLAMDESDKAVKILSVIKTIIKNNDLEEDVVEIINEYMMEKNG